jgi:hypothetical protein
MKVSFQCQTNKLIEGLEHIRTVLPTRKKKELYAVSLKIDVSHKYISLYSIGASANVLCQRLTNRNKTVLVPFEHFFQVVSSHGEDMITITVEGSKIKCGRSTIPGGEIIKDVTSKNKSGIKLSVKAKDGEILKFGLSHSEAEIGAAGLLLTVEMAKDRLEMNAIRASNFLKDYSITKDDLIKFVCNKIEEKK